MVSGTICPHHLFVTNHCFGDHPCPHHVCYKPLFQAPYFFFSEDGVGQTQVWMSTYVSILRIPQMI
jgi:hypothetical protein